MAGEGAGAVKVGPWGAPGGYCCDIDPATRPLRLESITVFSSNLPVGHISGFSFVYVDEQGETIYVGPWGKADGEGQTVRTATYSSSCVQVEVVQFSISPGEYVSGMAGTFDEYGVTSLTFTTNLTKHGPFGYPSGDAFSVPLPDDRDDSGAVVAFFGTSDDDGERLVAIGAYVGVAPRPTSELAASNVHIYGGSRGSRTFSSSSSSYVLQASSRYGTSSGSRAQAGVMNQSLMYRPPR